MIKRSLFLSKRIFADIFDVTDSFGSYPYCLRCEDENEALRNVVNSK